jgi:hypothetical protein
LRAWPLPPELQQQAWLPLLEPPLPRAWLLLLEQPLRAWLPLPPELLLRA